jgi:hypothetical protein
MKKFLTFLFLLISFVGFSQDDDRFYKRTRLTNRLETSRMVWNTYRNEWDFFTNNDKIDMVGEWEFTLDLVDQTGFIKSGEVVYTVKDIQTKESEYGTVVLMNVRNQKVNEDMFMIVGSPNGMFMIGIYRWDQRLVYYMTFEE